jgi:hypothetical protein
MSSAKVMFLDLEIPDDDPLRPAKIFVSTAAPGFRIFEKDETIDWESDYIWLMVINEEDGLDFRVRQTIDGKREIQAFWKERELDTSRLLEHLQEDPAWDVYKLRATVLVQQRVEMQMATLQGSQGATREVSVRETPWRLADRLRSLELNMLERAISAFESQVSSVSGTPHRPFPFVHLGGCRPRPRKHSDDSKVMTLIDVADVVEPRLQHAFARHEDGLPYFSDKRAAVSL